MHLLKDETIGRFAFVGGNCVQALTDLGAVRRRCAPGIAERMYIEERALRRGEPLPPAPDGASDMIPVREALRAVEEGGGARLVVAVAVLEHEEWDTLLQLLPLSARHWRFIALDDFASGLDNLIVLGMNGGTNRRR